jgi:DNA invertase Pin-like site-specific DNA recombinase
MRLLHAARLSQKAAGQTGLETQDYACQSWAAANDHEIIHTAADHKSGTSKPWERASLKPWVTDPDKMARYDGIIAYRFDRLSRGDDACTSEIEAWARKHGKVLLTEDGLRYPCEGVEGIRWDVTKRIAHEEWLKTSERYRRMQKHLRDRNYLVGRPPYGYLIVAKDNHKTLAPDPETGPYVARAAERYLDGQSLREVCEWLTAEGVRPPGRIWTPKTLGRMFRNPAITGRRKDGAGRTVLRYEPLIDVFTWKQLVARLDSVPGRRGPLSGERPMLSGVAVCGKCDGPMYRINARGFWYYRCYGTVTKPSTCANMVPMTELENWVNLWFSETGDFGQGEIMEVVPIPGNGHQDEVDEVSQDIRDLDLDDPEYSQKHAVLIERRKRLTALPSVPDRVEERGSGVKVYQHWATLDNKGKRAYLLAAGVKVHAARVEPGADGSPWDFWMTGDPYRLVGTLSKMDLS